MASLKSLKQTSLEAYCEEQGEKFYWISNEQKVLDRTLKSLVGEVRFPSQITSMYCGRVRDSVIFGKSYVIGESGRAVFLNQSHRNYSRDEFSRYYFNDIVIERLARPLIEDECCFLGGFSGQDRYFGHFIFEFLYRLVAFEMCGVLGKYPLVVFDEIPASWMSFIELYGVPRSMIIQVPQQPCPKFKAVWIASCPNFLNSDSRYSFWDDGIHFLRKRLREKASKQFPSGPGRVFLGRKGARHRRLVNENLVWDFLSSHGFVYPDLTGEPAAEQIAAVASAEIIVSVTGSNSSMTQFAPNNVSIIDIVPPKLGGGLGSLGFAAVIGQTYTRVEANSVSSSAPSGINDDIEVDLAILSKALELADKL